MTGNRVKPSTCRLLAAGFAGSEKLASVLLFTAKKCCTFFCSIFFCSKFFLAAHLLDGRQEGAHAEAVVQVAEHVLADEVARALRLHKLLEGPHVRAGQPPQPLPAGLHEGLRPWSSE